MNSWSNAIVVCIALVAGAWLLAVHAGKPEPPKPQPTPPGPPPVERPVEAGEATDAVGNPIQLYRDVRGLVTFAKQVQVAVQAASRELAKADLQEQPVEQPTTQPVATWQPPAGQVVLFFHAEPDNYQTAAAYVSGIEHGSKLIREGHRVYVGNKYRRQFNIEAGWLVLRDGREIYRDARPPVFRRPVQQPTSRPVYQSAPVYRQPVYRSVPVYRGGFSCVGGVCR